MKLNEAKERVRIYFKTYYNVDLKDLDISSSPGYWRDKKAKIHPGHPLHSCLFCKDPFKATYRYIDTETRDSKGRWISIYRTWRIIYSASKKCRK